MSDRNTSYAGPLPSSLRCDSNDDAVLQRLLASAHRQMIEQPMLVHTNYLGNLVLRCELPSDYHPRANRWCTELRARLNVDGWLFEIAECDERCSGGWMASCIPRPALLAFLRGWLVAPIGLRKGQLDLFAEVAAA